MKEIYLPIFYFTEPHTRLSRVIAAACPVSLVQCRPHHENEPKEVEVERNRNKVTFSELFSKNVTVVS